ncbi:hypothetical protein [Dyella caseinilytica]|uniref:DUF2846 domain-containing protein n=1 Tax=Dyella caseinilytica TaxID=1849581 RepID=A0ABX7GV46_9GAMM|nr:hypothetical protein [Dyella caseinilytica]QRN54179.1 hypothetical protein ISN74_01900 [Dyella caseinilytica]GFZ92134.1 hypothetical protein GCM10011408_09530 [Dyella caseinilytica]
MKIFARVLKFVLLIAVLASCTMNVKPNMDDTSQLPDGKGVLVARLAVPYLLKPGLPTSVALLNINNGSGVNIRLSSAETYLAIPLPAGSYRWNNLSVGSYGAHISSKQFEIDAGKINYVGDIILLMEGTNNPRTSSIATYRANFKIYDYHKHILPVLAAAYPKLWSNYPVVINLPAAY